ncbi:MAG: hypothetical protein ACT4P7_06160 [Gemmatimonadaceae bacterium]
MPACRSSRLLAFLCLSLTTAGTRTVLAQADGQQPMPRLHHVGLNSVDPDRAIEWYLRVWPAARRTVVAGQPAVEADMLLLFEKVSPPPPGAWRNDLQRSEPQSAFWHIGAFTNTTHLAARLAPVGVTHLPLFTGPDGTQSVWRSGLAPYSGTLTRAQLPAAKPAQPRDGGFSYVEAPDGVLLEGPYAFGETRALMIEDPDGLAIELIEGAGTPPAKEARAR